jgi:Phage major capsid protein E
MLDIFTTDAFSTVSLTAAIEKVPYQPGRIGALGLFRSEGIRTIMAAIEMRDGQLTLIPVTPRGGPGSSIGGMARNVRPFLANHLQRQAVIYADEVQGVRAFGSETATETVQALVTSRQTTLRAMHEVTLEYHRLGAIKGVVLDADGTTPIRNLFTEFGISQQSLSFDLADNVRGQCVAAQRLAEAELGATPITGYRAFCGDTFFDELISATSVVESLQYQEGLTLQRDLRAGFLYGGITWENYRGSVGGILFVPTDEAYLVPIGVPDLFLTYFAPADYIETVNTMGLPIYSKVLPDPSGANRFVVIDSQSNPLTICTRPRAVIQLTLGT